MKRRCEILLQITLVGVILTLILFFVLPWLARAKEGSWVTGEGKLADCTNRLITVRVKKLPNRTRGVVFAVPQNHLTNEVADHSGYLVNSTRPPITNTFTLSVSNRVRDVNLLERDPVSGNEFYTDNGLAAYWFADANPQSQLAHAPLKPGRAYTFSFYFFTTPPLEASLWLRW